MLGKALGLSPDAYVPDMEDSVPPAEKENARATIASFLPQLAQAGRPVIPRVNSIASGLLEGDLGAVVGPHVYGISVGKIGAGREVLAVDEMLRTIEERAGLEAGTTRLIPWAETALGVLNAYEICSASPRVVAVAFGADDLTNDMGIQRREDNTEVAFARSAVCLAARAADVLALDTPYVAFRDQEGLTHDAESARQYGFRGKFAIHPAQIDTINDAFSPSEGEVSEAERVIAAYEESERSGSGATSLDGKLIDAPVVKRARQLLELAGRTAPSVPVEG